MVSWVLRILNAKGKVSSSDIDYEVVSDLDRPGDKSGSEPGEDANRILTVVDETLGSWSRVRQDELGNRTR